MEQNYVTIYPFAYMYTMGYWMMKATLGTNKRTDKNNKPCTAQ